MSYHVDCENGNCHPARIPGGRRLHRHLHDNVSWYRDWHHHPSRPHFHLMALLGALLVAGFVLFSPAQTGLQAEVGGYPTAGRLILPSGQPVLDGFHEVTFRLYPVESGGTPVWAEIHAGADRILTVNGYYTTELGRLTRLDHIDLAATRYYVGVTVNGGKELTPRWPIGEMPLQPLGE